MFAQRAPQPGVFIAGDFFDAHKFAVQHVFGFGAEDVRQAAGHAGTEIQSQRTEDQHHPASHVFAAVLPDPLNNGEGAAVANGKTFAGTASDEKLPGSRAVQNGVSGEHIAAARSTRACGNCDGSSR